MRALLVALLLLCAGCKISCFGDSNTAASYPDPSAPTKKWVQYLNEIVPAQWQTVEHGVPSRSLVDVATVAGLAELDAEIATDQPLVVVLAYGSVDALAIAYQLETEDDAITALQTIMAHIHAIHPIITIFVASVPHTFRNIFWAQDVTVDSLNARIAAVVPANHLMDFVSISASEDAWDGLHFCGCPPIAPCTSSHGQQARAAVALAKLFP